MTTQSGRPYSRLHETEPLHQGGVMRKLQQGGVIAAGVVLLACVGCGGGTPTGGGAKSFQAVPPGQPEGAGRVAVSPQGAAGNATLAYWNGVNSLPAQMAPDMRAEPRRQVWALRRAAQVIRQNPTLGVDPDLVHWALRMATVLDQKAD